MFHWLQRVRHFKPVLVAQRWLNLFQGYPIPQGLSTQSRPEGRGLNPTFLVMDPSLVGRLPSRPGGLVLQIQHPEAEIHDVRGTRWIILNHGHCLPTAVDPAGGSRSIR